MDDMFYGATASVFENAKRLRSNLTKAEKIIWNHLSVNKVKGLKFRSQHPIAAFIADFYCHKAKLIIEIDGEIHNDIEQSDYDKGRTHDLEKLGLRIIRFSNQQVYNNLNEVLNELKNLFKIKIR